MADNPIIRILKPLTSLRLTVVTLSLAMVLVFIGTLAQQNLDAFYAQKKYFNTFFVWTSGKQPFPWFPGGYLLGTVFLVNLIAAHAVRFKLAWKKSGIILAHLGLILLLLGGLFTAVWSKDTRMTIEQGRTSNYSESFKDFELVIINKSNPDHDEVISIPQSFLAKQKQVQDSHLPFTVKPLEFHENARLSMRQPNASSPPAATKGMGVRMDVVQVPATKRPEEDNYPAAVIELDAATGSLGTWLLWAAPFGENIPAQTVTVDGKTYELQLRLKRFYKPYAIHLSKLTHEEYAGTNIPKNYASDIRLTDPARQENREVLIYMNHPLRYHGEAFFQFQTLDSDKFTVFEVVDNPSWWLPYLSCLLVGAGLILQFGMHFANFLKKRSA